LKIINSTKNQKFTNSITVDFLLTVTTATKVGITAWRVTYAPTVVMTPLQTKIAGYTTYIRGCVFAYGACPQFFIKL